MITMDKKYLTRDGRSVRLLCVDGPSDKYPVYGFAGNDLLTWSIDGSEWNTPGPSDLIEVVPDVVTYRYAINDGSASFTYSTIDKLRLHGVDPERIAILRITTRNGGKSHADVIVEVLPVDYQEPTP